jgi:hypothetical protein
VVPRAHHRPICALGLPDGDLFLSHLLVTEERPMGVRRVNAGAVDASFKGRGRV